jgi:primosomal protein N' (replication factor Y)
LKKEYRYQLLVKAADRRRLAAVIDRVRRHAQEGKWPATSLVIDVDPLSLQ